MRILVLEDDPLYEKSLRQQLEEGIPNVEIRVLHTESEFYNWTDDPASRPPDVFVLDVMVRWTDSAEEMPAPPLVVRQARFFEAGLRCEERLRNRPRMAAIPVVLFTVLDRSDLENRMRAIQSARKLRYVRKDEDIAAAVASVVSATTPPGRT